MPRKPSLGSSTTTALALFAALGLASAAYAEEPQTPATPDQQSGCTMRNGVAVGAGCGSTGATAGQSGVPGQARQGGHQCHRRRAGCHGRFRYPGWPGAGPLQAERRQYRGPGRGGNECQGGHQRDRRCAWGGRRGRYRRRLSARQVASVGRTGRREARAGSGHAIHLLSSQDRSLPSRGGQRAGGRVWMLPGLVTARCPPTRRGRKGGGRRRASPPPATFPAPIRHRNWSPAPT